MLALLFEVNPRSDGGWERYLAIATGLRPLLAEQEGMLFIDRYRSLLRPGTILSHSLWRDEAALAAWRSHGVHHCAQSEGRQQVFDDYRLRIAHVTLTAAPGQDGGVIVTPDMRQRDEDECRPAFDARPAIAQKPASCTERLVTRHDRHRRHARRRRAAIAAEGGAQRVIFIRGDGVGVSRHPLGKVMQYGWAPFRSPMITN